jgi:copper chaperone CopZ
MHCDNCVRNVTNALDSVEGAWARVDLGTRTAHVLSKGPIDQAAYRDVVRQAGYRVIGVAE